MFLRRLGDIAEIDMVSLTGPPLRYQLNPTAQGAGYPFRLPAYVFFPKDHPRAR